MKSGRIFVLALFVLVSPVQGSGSETAPFVVEVIDHADEVSLGLPVLTDVEIRNVSGVEQAVVALELDLSFESWPAAVKGNELPERGCNGCRKTFVVHGSDYKVASDWSKVMRRSFVFPAQGRYTYRYVLRMGPTGERVKKFFNAPEKHWIGEISSKTFTVIVREPEGVDAEAFRAVCALAPEHWAKRFSPAECYRMVWYPGEPTGAFSLLLTKHLDSTYTSYEIYRSYTRRWKGDAGFYDRYSKPENLNGIKDFGMCGAGANPSPNVEISEKLGGVDYLQCRGNWLGIVLENHPDTWFADEIRLILAGDAYLLGEKERCRSQLEGLIAKGRPYAAMRAQDLLDGMVEKGMLPPSPPRPGFTEGER